MNQGFSHLRQRGLSLLLAVITTCSLLGSVALAAGTLPEPTDVFYVADFANVLESDTVNDIVSANQYLQEETGAQIVVATVDYLDGYEMEDYAYALFNNWKIGDSTKNNGVLLLLAIEEENYWCIQGRGLEKSLSSTTIDDLLWDYLETDFAQEDYDAGVQKTFNALYDILAKQYGLAGIGGTTPVTPGGTTAPSGNTGNSYQGTGRTIGWFSLIVLLIIVLALFNSFRRAFSPRRRTVVVVPPIIRPRRRTIFGRRWHSGPVVPPPPRAPRPPKPPKQPQPGSWGNPKPRPPASGGGLFGGGSLFGGGGSTRGGGSGRSSSSNRSSSSSRSSSSRSSSGRSSGGSRGGGGSSRGGGGGRRGR